MKDTWTKPFKDKLDDFELDVPVPAGIPGHRAPARWLLPLSAAAAAALALLLLPYGHEAGIQRQLPLIAEAAPAVQAAMPALPDAALRGIRQQRLQPVRTGTLPAEEAEESVPILPEETQPEPSTQTPEPAGPQSVAEQTQTTEPVDEWWREAPEQQRKAAVQGGFSAKAYAGNFIAAKSHFIQTPDLPLLASAAYHAAISDDLGEDVVASANSFKAEAVRFGNVATATPIETVCDLPLKAGLALRYDFSPFFGLESGLTYSFHRAKQSYTGSLNGSYYRDFRMHYIGIPLKADFTFVRLERAAFYLNMGGEVEWMAAGRAATIDGVNLQSARLAEHPLQFSLLGSAGAEYFLGRRVGLYAEPGLAWHPAPSGNLPSYYREHPWSFDLRIGLRLRLN